MWIVRFVARIAVCILGGRKRRPSVGRNRMFPRPARVSASCTSRRRLYISFRISPGRERKLNWRSGDMVREVVVVALTATLARFEFRSSRFLDYVIRWSLSPISLLE